MAKLFWMHSLSVAPSPCLCFLSRFQTFNATLGPINHCNDLVFLYGIFACIYTPKFHHPVKVSIFCPVPKPTIPYTSFYSISLNERNISSHFVIFSSLNINSQTFVIFSSLNINNQTCQLKMNITSLTLAICSGNASVTVEVAWSIESSRSFLLPGDILLKAMQDVHKVSMKSDSKKIAYPYINKLTGTFLTNSRIRDFPPCP